MHKVTEFKARVLIRLLPFCWPETPVIPKRQPKGPRDGFLLKNAVGKMETIAPIPYDILKEGLLSS